MLLSPLQQEFLIANIRQVISSPVCICDTKWNILVFTGQNYSEAEDVIKRCSKENDLSKISKELCVEVQPYYSNKKIMGYVLSLKPSNSESVFPFIFTLLDLLLNNNSKTNAERIQDARTQLANQLAFYDKTNWEILSFMKLLDYSFGLPRCAVLFCLSEHQNNYILQNFHVTFTLLHLTSSHYTSEDIFGPISQDKFLVFKNIDGASMREKILNAKKYAEDLLENLSFTYNISACAFIGSPYVKIEKLHNSFLEANFLYNNSYFLSKNLHKCMTIDKYLLPYLSNMLPNQFKEILFHDYDLALSDSKTIEKTIEAIATNNNNLTLAANELGIHRNTIFQRFRKIQESLSIDPLYNDIDRSSLYCYSFFKSQTITWHACVNIQPGNIQQRSLQKFSELLQQKSGGRMQLSIEVISKAGDYRQLFESVCSGKIDCVSVNTGLLFNSIKAWPHVLELPFLFDSAQEANYLLNGYLRKEMSPTLNAMGTILAGFWSMGWRYLTSNEPIYTPADMQGKRVRVVAFMKIIKDFFNSMNSTVIVANYKDIPELLETGVVNCQENPYSNILAMEFYKKQKYVTELDMLYDVNAVLFSKSAWDSLPNHLQEVVLEAFEEACQWMLLETERINLEAREKLIYRGMQIISPNSEQRALWKKAANEVYASIKDHFLVKGLFREKEIYHDRQKNRTVF